MAEILLSLTIIGVVAAITLPSLTGNINERTWNTQRKALYSRLSQAVSLMPQIRGYGSVAQDTGSPVYGYGYTGITKYKSENATETFVANGLAKVLKLNNICDADHLGDCGIPNVILPLARNYGSGCSVSAVKIETSTLKTIAGLNQAYEEGACEMQIRLDTKAAAFETANGESVLVHYNPLCYPHHDRVQTNGIILQPLLTMCANFIYDLNGKKGPNTIGKDIGFMSLFYPSDSKLVSPVPVKHKVEKMSYDSAQRFCKSVSDNGRIPNLEEMASMTVNMKFMSITDNEYSNYITSTKVGDRIWYQEFYDMNLRAHLSDPNQSWLSQNFNVQCVER